jgi:hypothetical protein
MLRRSPVLVAMLCLVQGLGCREAAEVVIDEKPPPVVSTDFARLPDILAGVRNTGDVRLHQGLPSEFWEPQLRMQELAQKETLDVHGHPVYEEQLTPSGADVEQLTSILSATESYQSFDIRNRKKCGGFTAEYCVEWTTGESVTQLLICLECREVILFAPQSELHCNLAADAAQRLKQLLARYDKNRPSESANP